MEVTAYHETLLAVPRMMLLYFRGILPGGVDQAMPLNV
jgi:hypothetical protein